VIKTKLSASSKKQVSGLVRVIDAGCDNLRKSLDNYYWPALGGNEISERNISFYTAAALAENDFKIFAEPNFSPLRARRQPTSPAKGKARHRRLDFLAISKDRKIRIVVEAKRFYSSGKAAEIVGDIDRMRRFRLLKKWAVRYALSGKRQPTHGLVIATTWQRNYRDWWCSPHKKGPKRRRFGASAKSWGHLSNRLVLPSVRAWATTLSTDGGNSDANLRQQFALLALFPIT
jgi:hypothetical protein